jgi:regulator of sigma D
MSETESVEVLLAKDKRKQLLMERRVLLSSYYKLSGFKESDAGGSMNTQVTVFCQILMDYAALGHFEIFERISDGKERRSNIQKKADLLYPLIVKSTDSFVEFNDKYAGNKEIELLLLIEDVASLGESIDDRFNCEDQLLKSMWHRRT